MFKFRATSVIIYYTMWEKVSKYVRRGDNFSFCSAWGYFFINVFFASNGKKQVITVPGVLCKYPCHRNQVQSDPA